MANLLVNNDFFRKKNRYQKKDGIATQKYVI